MRMLGMLCASIVALASTGTVAIAADGDSGYRTTKHAKSASKRTRHAKQVARAPQSSHDCGLRDHARNLGSFNDTCEAEEFWVRMQERGPSPN
jgi:hypothetical protein